MYYHRHGFFYRLTRSIPCLRAFDVYDPRSFIRQSVLDNIFVCVLVYCLFYFGLWYADKVIGKIERVNEKLFAMAEDNKTKLDDLLTLKKKRLEYEDVVIKSKGIQRQTTQYLEAQIKKITEEAKTTEEKICEIEKMLGKCKAVDSSFNTGLSTSGGDGEVPTFGNDETSEKSEDVKILEPSFPPPLPPEPPPRKYGIFVSRPPGQRIKPGSTIPPPSPPPKIGFK